jgi:tetratricopeptide (TPR) repeat protein
MNIQYPIGWSMKSIFAFAFIVLTFLCTSIAAQEYTADYWLQKGDEFYKNNSYDLALRCYDKAIGINPLDADAWHCKGNVLREMNRTIDADAAFAKATELNISKVSDVSSTSDSGTSDLVASTSDKEQSHYEVQDYIMSREKYVLLDSLDDLTTYELGYSEADPGKQYILVNIKVENHGYDEFNLDPFCIKMIVNKIVYDRVYLSLATNGYPPLEEVTLQDGGEMSGYIAFSVPDGTDEYSLRYDQWSWDDYNIKWME